MTKDTSNQGRERARADVPVSALLGAGPRLSAAPLPRRAVLRGLGVALALPWLEASAGAAPGAAPPLRLWYVYSPNGVNVDQWRLAPGPLPALLPSSLAPLEPWRAELLHLRGLTQAKARANGDGPGDHARAAAVWLTGVQPLKSDGRVRLGVSADQVVAEHIGGATRERSIVLGTEEGRVSGECDSGYACAYSNNISWASEVTPMSKLVDPLRAFDRLFRGEDDGLAPEERRARHAARRSVLDFVRTDTRVLARRLGAEDRQRLIRYEDGVRELERRLQRAETAVVEAVPDAARPQAAPTTFSEHAALLGDVMVLAFQADVTRVGTLMLGNEGSGRRYTEVDVSEAHHPLSHHGGAPEKLAQIQRIDALHVSAVAHCVAGLAAIEEHGARLLDRTLLVHGACIADGNRHDHHDLPTQLLGGRLAGLGPRGVSVGFENGTPLNDLHLALIERMGVPSAALGDGRGPLAL
ncbi:MAG: DUF1552 domain-containing protein [Planctomycetota bacterium]